MIITKEFLAANDCCKEGYARGLELNILNLEHEEIIATLRENGEEDYAAWVEFAMQSATTIKFLGEYAVTRYMVFNPLLGQYEYADSIENARVLKARIINDFVQANVVQYIDTQREIQSPDGTTAYEKIDLEGA